MNLQMLAVHVQATLRPFVDPAHVADRATLIAALRPTAEDYSALFVPAAAERARAGYDAALWAHPPLWPIKPEQTRIFVRAIVTSEDLIASTGDASKLPGGYAQLGAQLLPGALWIAWEFVAPDQSDGLYFDGLVPRFSSTASTLPDRYVWLPKPWRVLGA